MMPQAARIGVLSRIGMARAKARTMPLPEPGRPFLKRSPAFEIPDGRVFPDTHPYNQP
jgi:hypothetical protein